MDTVVKAENLSQLRISETVNGGTVCGKAAHTGLWGSGEATNRSTRKVQSYIINKPTYVQKLSYNRMAQYQKE